jgi:hypothetical protein
VGEMSLVEKERKKTLFIFFRRKLYGVFETESAALEATHIRFFFSFIFLPSLLWTSEREPKKN